MNRNPYIWQTIRFGMIALLIWSCPAVSFAESYRRPRSTDELLNYTLKDLQSRMQQIAENNQKIGAKNAALQKRLMLLRQHFRDLENSKILLFEKSIEMADEMNLEQRASGLSENRVLDLYNHRDELDKQQIRLQRLINDHLKKQAQEERKVIALEKELAALQAKQGKKKAATIKDYYERERLKYVQLIRESRQRLKRIQNEIAVLRKRVTGPAGVKQRLLDDQVVLRESLGEVRQEFEALKSRQQILEEEADMYSSQKRETIRQASSEIAQLKLYRTELEVALNRIRETIRLIASEFKDHQPQLQRFGDLLRVQGQVLEKKNQVVARGLEKTSELKTEVKGALVLRDQQNERLQEKDLLERSRQNQHDRITNFKEQKEAWRDQEGVLKRELSQLERQIKGAKNISKSSRQQVLKDKKRELSILINDYVKKERTQQREQKQLQAKIKKLAAEKEGLERKRRSLQGDLLAAETRLSGLRGQEPNIDRLKQDFAIEQEQEALKLSKDVQELRQRKMVLTSSLSVIQSRYNKGDLNLRGFSKEQRELRQYLIVLKEENESLQEKVLSMLVALDRLKARKAALEWTP